MARNISLALILVVAVCSVSIAAYVEAVAGVFDITRGHILPQVTLRCGFLNKHMDLGTGLWVDGDMSSPCDVSKNAILDYCRQVYSEEDVNNIEDSNEDVEISHWCPMDAPDMPEGCTETFTVTAYTCLVGTFESKALMVPKGCNFEHIHDSEICKPKSELHSMADKQCAANDKLVRDYGMLLPCPDEVDLFTGVEFVCCVPLAPKTISKPAAPEEVEPAPAKPQVPDVAPEKAPVTETEQDPATDPMPDDPYFKQAPAEDDERDAFEGAKERMEEVEDMKRIQVVQQWQEAQDQYETLKKTRPKEAETLKKDMMVRFDDTMAELEEAGRKEHEQLRAVHQRRVQTMLTNQRTLAEQMFAETLREEAPKTKKVLHILQKYVRAIQRDKQHSLNIYKHLLGTDPAHAEAQRLETLRRLQDMDASIQHCLEMLKKAPEVYQEIQAKVEDLLAESQSPEDTAFLQSMETALSITTPTEEEEEEEEEEVEVEVEVEEEDEDIPEPAPPKKTSNNAIPSKPSKPSKPFKPLAKAPIVAKILPPFSKVPSGRKVPDIPDLPMVVAKIEPELPEVLEEPEEPAVAVKGEALPIVKIVNAEIPEPEEEQPAALVDEDVSLPQHIPIIAVKPLGRYFDDEDDEFEMEAETAQEPSEPAEPSQPEAPVTAAKPILVAKKQPQKSQKAAASKMDKGAEFRPKASGSIDNSVSQKSLKYGATPALAFGLACGVLAVATVMVVAVVLVRRKTRRVPVNHGFTELDPNMTVEQRHIAAMQANGYENPTYKYFEMQ